ncbi:transcriptional regulator [Flavobacterium sp. PL002]|uniref:transcriptional regulator n=1 Tax=Flavobacterium sp. PL002 TaxID=1897058 RepID=UPI0017881388|nr:transcriptional regulator [Flavobacterium sp. PL002]
MNYIKHLTGFFNKINNEKNLNPTHISLYLTLFQCWNVNRFKNPTGISREEIMKSSKINSKATYHKCMRELQILGFIEYNPTFNPHSSSNVNMINFSDEVKTISKVEQLSIPKNEPVQNLTVSKNEQVIEQVNGQLYIYNNKTDTNNINNIERTPEFEILDDNLIIENQEKNQKKKSCAKKEKAKSVTSNVSSRAASRDENPTLELIKEYFKFQEYSEFEAERFFNYYSSNGWLIGGKTKMKDWKAAARNWMLNTAKFTMNIPKHNPVKEQQRAYNLHTETDKNYGEPL